MSFEEFQEYLDSSEFDESHPEMNGMKIDVIRDLVPRIKDIIIDSFCAVKSQLNPGHRKNHFELFGYDFMIDEDFRVWLIEINSNPYLGTPNKFTKQLVPNMINELLELVLDPVYAPSPHYQKVEKREFELIYQESSFGTEVINQRRSFNQSLLYPLLSDNNMNLTNASLKHHHTKDLRLLRKKYRVDMTNFGSRKNEPSLTLATREINGDSLNKRQIRKLVSTGSRNKKRNRRAKTVNYSMSPKAKQSSNEDAISINKNSEEEPILDDISIKLPEHSETFHRNIKPLP